MTTRPEIQFSPFLFVLFCVQNLCYNVVKDRLFALLTAGKRNGTCVYAEIFVS